MVYLLIIKQYLVILKNVVKNIDIIINSYIIKLFFMTLEESLIKYGFSQKEVKIYLAVLDLGQASVLEVSRKSNIKRPTAYIILDDLIKRGLIRRLPKKKGDRFIASNPEKLVQNLKSKEKELSRIIPLLQAMYKVKKNRPSVKYFEGKKGVKEVYDEIRKAKKYIDFFGSIEILQKKVPSKLLSISDIKKMNIDVRELMPATKVNKEYFEKVKKYKNKKHQVKLMSREIKLETDNAIFDNKIAIISIKKNYFAVVIESQDIAQSYRNMYELAYKSL